MAASYISVPRDLTKVKSKVMFNLTKRQLICFWLGGTNRGTVIFSDENSDEDQHGSHGNDGDHDAIFSWQCMKKTDSRWKSFWNT